MPCGDRSFRRCASHKSVIAILALALCAAVQAGAPSLASAQLGQMPIYELSPASGSRLTLLPTYGSTQVVFKSDPATVYDMIAGITLEVASQNVQGQDGTLSDDFNVDYNVIHAGDTSPGYYLTAFRNFNFDPAYHAPGVYYFQFSGYTYASHQHVASPVFSFVWDPSAAVQTTPTATPTTTPSLKMSRANALAYLRYLIRHKSGHRPKRLRPHCTQVTSSSFSCTPTFHSGRRAYSGHFIVRHYVGSDGTTVYWTGYFLGRRSGGAKVYWLI